MVPTEPDQYSGSYSSRCKVTGPEYMQVQIPQSYTCILQMVTIGKLHLPTLIMVLQVVISVYDYYDIFQSH
jgi:hypothetical protein